MHTFLFKYLVFGPISSRRLGRSLGLNILPKEHKLCNFDCVYCECGEDHQKHQNVQFPTVEEILEELLLKCQMLNDRDIKIDTISFAGNGEPTLHPDFEEIMYAVKTVRDLLLPDAKIAVLNNSTMLHKRQVRKALEIADYSICKLDAGDESTFYSINRPLGNLTYQKVKDNLRNYGNKIILQSLFFKGKNEQEQLGNYNDQEVEKYLSLVESIKPESVMLYSLDRTTAIPDLEAVSIPQLKTIAERLNHLGITATVA
ncbi:radical SAM protein [Lishizhenia sp.]|uniref:radical SAM protein n=1 Tax=Lishizhenia sp. TaxID=2497594 RepID=UPI00299E538D|nr:radical SAM protein [Lishizhenia sp.]MDX1444919.1 radical SAM protein [Lishizhenia sp.]